MYKLWIVEDDADTQDPLHQSLTDALGRSKGGLAEWEVFDTAKDVIERCFACLSSGDAFPDVAIVDASLEHDSEEDALHFVGDKPQRRGFIVAAALQAFSKGKTILVIYTGNQVVKHFKSEFLSIPHELSNKGVRPLLTIEDKADANPTEMLIGWIRTAVRQLSERAVKDRGHDELATPALMSVVTRLQDMLAAEREMDRMLEPLFDEVQRLEADYEKASTSERDATDCFLDVSQLAEARASRRPATRLHKLYEAFLDGASTGWVVDRWKVDIEPRANQLRLECAKALSDSRLEVQHLLKLIQASGWYSNLGELAPFEAHLLNSFASGSERTLEDCLQALNSMLSLLDLADHTASLARAFLSMESSPGAGTVPTTVFAHACHGWSHRGLWQYPVPYPTDVATREQYLEAELGGNGGADFSFQRLVLPEASLKRIKEYGESLDPYQPLNAFATAWCNRASGCRQQWEREPKQYFLDYWGLGEEKWDDTCHEQKSEPLLTDWWYLFNPTDSLISEMMGLKKPLPDLPPPSQILVTWRNRGRKASVRFVFETASHLNRLDLAAPRGDLTKALRKFLQWGSLEIVCTSDRNVSKLTYADGEHNCTEIPAIDVAPRFEMELTIVNYSRRMLWREE